MIVVKVELWPYGSKNAAEEIGRIHIVNDGSGNVEVGNYQVYAGPPESYREEATDIGEVRGHRRSKGVFNS